MNPREERQARNEALFREVNERVRELADTLGDGRPGRHEFFCECADAACTARIAMTIGEYETVRASPTWFFIVPGHAFPDIEQVVRLGDGYEVVDKIEAAGELAAESDPRR